MSKSTNKTSAAIERLAGYGDVLISKGDLTPFGDGLWAARVYKVQPSATLKEPINSGCGDTLDDALNAALRELEDE